MSGELVERDAIPGVDLGKLEAWMDEAGLGAGPIEQYRRLSGGTQNVLLRFSRANRPFILRRGPLALRSESNKTMMREARLLQALADTPVRHPRFVAGSDDPDVIGASFYLMDVVEGFNATLDPPSEMRSNPAVRYRMGLSLIEALVEISRVDPLKVGLGDFGKLDGFIDRQVGRWAAQLESYAQFPEWRDSGKLDGIHALGAWLEAHRPTEMQAGIMHGDYHIGNVIYAPDGEIAAVVDWEMATLGDPLLDLARLLSSWPDDDGKSALDMRVEPADGFPSRQDMIAHYAAVSGRDLRDLKWFEVLSCYKLAIILEGTYARALNGKADMATGQRLHTSALALLKRAHGLISLGLVSQAQQELAP